MKVLFLVYRFWPSVGGVENYVRHLANAVRAAGHEVAVVAGDTQGELPAIDAYEGITVHRFPAARSTLRCRFWMWRHRGLFTDSDVIQVSNTHMLEFLWRMLGPVLDRRRIFLTRHGYGGTFPIPESQLHRARRSLALASGFVHDGEFISRWLHVPADITPRQGLVPKALELPVVPEPPPTSAVYVGRLEPDTAISIYLDGIRELVTRHRRPMTFHVFGDGSLAGQLRAQAADERLPIEFHGARAGAQDQISKYCFAFIDGRMAIQEAMARRRVVIAAYANPLRRDYVCGESFSSFLVPVANASGLTAEVMRFMDDTPARRALTDRAFEYAKTLTWVATARQFLALWQTRLALKSPPLAFRNRLGFMNILSRRSVDVVPNPIAGHPAATTSPLLDLHTS